MRKHSYNVTPEELFDLFGKFGPVRYAQELFNPRRNMESSDECNEFGVE